METEARVKLLGPRAPHHPLSPEQTRESVFAPVLALNVRKTGFDLNSVLPIQCDNGCLLGFARSEFAGLVASSPCTCDQSASAAVEV